MTDFRSPFRSEQGRLSAYKAYDRLLNRWPVYYEELLIPTSYGQTHVIISGSDPGAPPLVLLHGESSNALSWLPNIEELSQSFCVFAINTIGEPNKSEAPQLPLMEIDVAVWLTELLDFLGIQQTYMAGISAGGHFALRYAMEMPNRVSKVMLLGPAFLDRLSFSYLVKSAWARSIMPSASKLKWFTASMSASQNELLDDEWNELTAEILRPFRPNYGRTPQPFSDAMLQTLCVPVHILMGDQESIYQRPVSEIASRLRVINPNIKVTIMSATGHILNMEQPAQVNKRMLDFFQAHLSVKL